MTQAPLRTALLAAGAALGASLALTSACSKPAAPAATTTTTVAAAQPRGTLVPPPAPPFSASSDLAQTAAVSPPGDTNGKLPPTPGERETLAAAREAAPR